MNYRHAFHAGNHADVLKHMVLVYCLDHLRRKDTPFAVLDTHAGRGVYDLASAEAERSPEWRGGVGRLWDWAEPPALVGRYLDAVRLCAEVPQHYPGSPLLIASGLRAHDQAMACELHAEDAAALAALLRSRPDVHVHHRDGYEAMGALLPPAPKRGLVLIDPPYEAHDELKQATAALKVALKRFAHGTYLWWRPLKDPRALDRADAELGAGLRADLWTDNPAKTSKLVGSSLFVINPPFGLEDALHATLPALAARLSQGAHGWRIR